jgi:hypothetical protein
MAKYYFHCWVDHCLVAHRHASDQENAYAAFIEAFETARDLYADTNSRPEDWARARIEIVDHSGRVLFDLPVSEAVGAP